MVHVAESAVNLQGRVKKIKCSFHYFISLDESETDIKIDIVREKFKSTEMYDGLIVFLFFVFSVFSHS